MLDARNQWRNEADQVRQFVEECCALRAGETKKTALYSAYSQWAENEGVNKVLKQKTFTNRLALMDVGERRTGTHRYYTGISLVNQPERTRYQFG